MAQFLSKKMPTLEGAVWGYEMRKGRRNTVGLEGTMQLSNGDVLGRDH